MNQLDEMIDKIVEIKNSVFPDSSAKSLRCVGSDTKRDIVDNRIKTLVVLPGGKITSSYKQNDTDCEIIKMPWIE